MNGLEPNPTPPVVPIVPTNGASSPALVDLSPIHVNYPTIADARIASLKVLVFTLLGEIESLENRLNSPDTAAFNLQEEVHRFEAALIRVALSKTGGRQRRAARHAVGRAAVPRRSRAPWSQDRRAARGRRRQTAGFHASIRRTTRISQGSAWQSCLPVPDNVDRRRRSHGNCEQKPAAIGGNAPFGVGSRHSKESFRHTHA